MLDGLRESDFGERSTDEFADALEASMEHSSSASRDPDIATLKHFKRDERGMRQVAQFVRQEPEALIPAHGLSTVGERSLARVLADRTGDGVGQAAIQEPKVSRAHGCTRFDRQLRDGLTDVAIIVDDLRHREPLAQHVVPVEDRASANLRM
jgi:hypothetical protein